MKLSIIVPIYNTEKYLKQCIESLLKQDIQDYEIILVNDSSPDNSQQIMDKYKKEYPKHIKLLKKSNGGLGDTRNYAISYANGKYIMFVDSDDYIKENCLNELCYLMDKNQLDILVFDFVKVYDNKKFVHEKSIDGDCTERNYILSTPNACNKIFRKDLFCEHHILFPTKIWYEDLAIIPGLVKYTKNIGYIHKGIYFYQYRSQSIMNQKSYNPKILDMIQSIDNLSYYLKDSYKTELEYLSLLHLYYGSSLKLIPFKKYNELKQCLNTHENNFPQWKENSYYQSKPFLFRIYCYGLSKRWFRYCTFLLSIRKLIAQGG